MPAVMALAAGAIIVLCAGKIKTFTQEGGQKGVCHHNARHQKSGGGVA